MFSRFSASALRLFGGPRLQGGAESAPRQKHSDRSAERAGADDDGALGARGGQIDRAAGRERHEMSWTGAGAARRLGGAAGAGRPPRRPHPRRATAVARASAASANSPKASATAAALEPVMAWLSVATAGQSAPTSLPGPGDPCPDAARKAAPGSRPREPAATAARQMGVLPGHLLGRPRRRPGCAGAGQSRHPAAPACARASPSAHRRWPGEPRA